MFFTVEELFQYMLGKENIWFYGAGNRAERYLYCCRKKGIFVDGILVSAREENPSAKDGIQVLALDELAERDLDAKDLNVVVTMAGGMKKWLSVFCEMPSFKSVVFLAEKLYREMGIQELKYRFGDAQDRYELVTDYPLAEAFQGVLIECRSGQAVMRIPQHFGMQLLPQLLESASREEFEKEFGALTVLPAVKATGITDSLARKEKIEIYVAASHLDKSKSEPSQMGGYLPIQAGAALTETRICRITDDTGDHISDKNRDYCECTGLYWIWKNTAGQNYVGLCHYRRRLMLDDESVRYMKQYKVDLVTAHPQFERDCIRDYFLQYIYDQDWQLLKQEIANYDPLYTACFERYEKGRFYFPCNIALWKRNWFDRYCEFAFRVAESIEAFYKERGIVREDRYMGYLFEQMSTIFIMRHYHEMKIVCSQIEWVK